MATTTIGSGSSLFGGIPLFEHMDGLHRLGAAALTAALTLLLLHLLRAVGRFLRIRKVLAPMPEAPGGNWLLGHALAMLNAPSQHGERRVVSLLLSEGCGGERTQERGGTTTEVVVTAPSSSTSAPDVPISFFESEAARARGHRWTDALISMLEDPFASGRGRSGAGRDSECPRRGGKSLKWDLL